MEPDKNNSPDSTQGEQATDQSAPADALSRTPDELEEEQAAQAAANPDAAAKTDPAEKKISPIKRLFRKVNLYLLIFLLLFTVAAVVMVVNYLNSQKPPVTPDVASQTLSQDALKQLANTDASVGSTSQTLTIQGNAVIAGQTLMRGNLNVAGNLQTGGNITAPGITISGSSNLGTAQINTLQVAQNVAIQGSTTMRDINVAGTASFSGPITASQLTVSRLILSGNAILQVPNHVAFSGPTPGRASVNNGVLGNGGSLSIGGSDMSGTININSGNNPSAGCFGRFTFAQAFSGAPRVVVSPVGPGAAQLQYYVTRTGTSFELCTANPAPANQTFAFDYFIAG